MVQKEELLHSLEATSTSKEKMLWPQKYIFRGERLGAYRENEVGSLQKIEANLKAIL